jgi:hypothetical protein
VNKKQHTNRIRQIVEADALDAIAASAASYVPRDMLDSDFKIISAYRTALVDWVYHQADLVGIDIVNRFNEEVFTSLDIAATIKGWQRWAAQIMNAIEAKDTATVERLKDGPEIAGGEGLQRP